MFYIIKKPFSYTSLKGKIRILVKDCLPVTQSPKVPNAFLNIYQFKTLKVERFKLFGIFTHLLNIWGYKQAIISKI